MFAMSDAEYAAADAWLETTGLLPLIEESAKEYREGSDGLVDGILDKVIPRFLDTWQEAAVLMTYRQTVADVMVFRVSEGELFEMSVDEWLAFSKQASWYAAREKARSMAIDEPPGTASLPKRPRVTTSSREVWITLSPSLSRWRRLRYSWMETATADLAEAKAFADAVHADFLTRCSPITCHASFSWDTTGMSDDQMKHFPEELGKLGFVFNFITYGGHQIDGLAAEEFATALRQDGMLSLARLQRKFRLLESPYRDPANTGRRAASGCCSDGVLRAHSNHQGHGQGIDPAPAPGADRISAQGLEDWLQIWAEHNGLPPVYRVRCVPSPQARISWN